MDVAGWLQGLGLERYVPAFRDNEIDWEALPKLTAEDLKDLGVVLGGHRRKLLAAIAALGAAVPAATVTPASGDARAPAEAERRQLTVMFCDLVGSTALSARLDPEDLREVIGSVQRRVAQTVARFDGFVAKYMGDGVLVYFGYPHAHEDDPEQAVRAGLALIDAVGELQVPQRLQVRIGIATGLVVVGDLIGAGSAQEQAVVGETPNLAARLQALADPGAIVISESTRRQIGARFEVSDLGSQSLRGFAEPQRAWRALSENRVLGRYEALRSGATPLVGRDEELDLLLRRWAQAEAGSGRVVLISGEPGVGKSRLAEALAQRISGERHTRLRYFCSAHHQDSALHPIIAQMERTAGFARDDVPTARLAKLQAVLAATAPPLEDVALIAELHPLPSADRAPPLEVTPRRKKEKMFEALLRQVQRLSQAQPVLMMFEDVHWIDPSSARVAGPNGRADRELAGVAAGDVPPRIPATLDRAAAGDDARSDAARPARYRGDGAKHRRQCGAANRDRGGDRRAHGRRAAVRRGTDRGGARIRRTGYGRPVRRAAPGIVGTRDLVRLVDGAAGSAGTGGERRCANRRGDRPRVRDRAAGVGCRSG